MSGFVVILLIPYAILFVQIATVRGRRMLFAVSGFTAVVLAVSYWWVTRAREGEAAEQGLMSMLILLAGAGVVAAFVGRVLISVLPQNMAALRWPIWLLSFLSVPLALVSMGPP